MVDINAIWNAIIKGLNSINQNYTFLRPNEVHNLPPYPYITVNCSSAYIKDVNDIRGILSQELIDNSDQIKLTRTTTPKMVFSFNCYSDSIEQCLTVLQDTQDYLNFTGQQTLESNGIVILECSNVTDRTTFMEVDYKYQYGFDCTIRVVDTVSMNVDSINKVEILNENSIETFDILMKIIEDRLYSYFKDYTYTQMYAYPSINALVGRE